MSLSAAEKTLRTTEKMDRYKILRNPTIEPCTSEDAEEQYIQEKFQEVSVSRFIDFFQQAGLQTAIHSSRKAFSIPRPVESRLDKVGQPWYHIKLINNLHIDRHEKGCTCSYCRNCGYGARPLHFGLNIPKSKSWNSWWIVKYWNHRYVRWTFPFLKHCPDCLTRERGR